LDKKQDQSVIAPEINVTTIPEEQETLRKDSVEEPKTPLKSTTSDKVKPRLKVSEWAKPKDYHEPKPVPETRLSNQESMADSDQKSLQ
jgi:hypothetical protein